MFPDNGTKALIQLLGDCVQSCDECIRGDLMEKEVMMMARCIKLDLDCAEICAITSRYLTRKSEFGSSLVTLCAVICDACAKECEKFPDMPHCVECARVCRRCAKECREFQGS